MIIYLSRVAPRIITHKQAVRVNDSSVNLNHFVKVGFLAIVRLLGEKCLCEWSGGSCWMKTIYSGRLLTMRRYRKYGMGIVLIIGVGIIIYGMC